MHPFIFLLITGMLLGFSSIMLKTVLLQGIGPLPYLAWSCLIASILLKFRAGHRDDEKFQFRFSIIAGALSIAIPQWIISTAILHVGAGFIGLVHAMPPILTYVLAVKLGLEKGLIIRYLGVVCALIGSLWVSIAKSGIPKAEVGWIAFALSVPVVIALGNVFRTKYWPDKSRPQVLASEMLFSGGILLLMLGSRTFTAYENFTFYKLVFIQSMIFAVQYECYFKLQKLSGPSYLSFIGSVSALTTIPLAIFLFDEPLPPALPIGGSLMLLGVISLLKKTTN